MWVYSDYRLPYNARLAQLVQSDIIKIDPGEPGSIETTFVSNQIPAITLELGPPSIWNKSYIGRATDFVFRLLVDLRIMMTDGDIGREEEEENVSELVVDPVSSRKKKKKQKQKQKRETYVSTNRIDVPTTRAGWAEALVDVLEDVRQGQEVVTVYDSWGVVVEKVKAPAAGRVLQVRTDPAVEGGSIVLVIVNNGTTT